MKNTDWFWKDLDSYLDKHQLKQTRQRKLVIESFLSMEKHVDAEMLHKRIKDNGLNIGLATIYRTLNLLLQVGLVEQKSFSDGRTLYEVLDPNEHHDHLVCLDCGLVLEFHNEEIEQLQIDVAKQNKFELKSHQLDMYGICHSCQK